ncbi:prephenate dehydrogenase/arogenate dehydrogenase family protein [Anaerolineales bacterium]
MTEGRFFCNHLSVVGLGLMGASIAMALRPYVRTITGIDPLESTRDFATQNKIVDDATASLQAGVAEADVVILATPVRIMLDIINKRIGSYLRSNTLLMDIGSTKHDICDAMGQLPIGVNAIGGHPMTGKERNGIEVAEAGIFQGRPFVLCPTRRTTPATISRALELVNLIEAVPYEMDSIRHDKVVAGISHLPYMLSACLVGTIASATEKDQAFWDLAAGGFRDTSRLAASDIAVMTDILGTNTRAVATMLAMFRAQLASLEAMLLSGEEQDLVDRLTPIRSARIRWEENYEQKRNK